MRYIVNTDEPTWCGGSPRNYVEGDCIIFAKGDLVEVSDPSPDGDGDVTATNLTRAEDSNTRDRYIALSCLTPEADYTRPEDGTVTISSVRAALTALGIEADVVAVAQAIDAAKETARG